MAAVPARSSGALYRSARRPIDPRRRVQARLTAGDYQAALTVYNPACCFAADHWLRQGCLGAAMADFEALPL